MIKILIKTPNFPEKDLTPSIWKSRANERVSKVKVGSGAGFYKEGYELLYTPKAGYSSLNLIYEEIYD